MVTFAFTTKHKFPWAKVIILADSRYGQVIKLFDKSKILQFSRERGSERYTKRFNGWIHLIVMLYAVIMQFDSLREITASLLAETRKLSHLGITFKIITVR